MGNVKWEDSLAVKFIMSNQLITQIVNSRAVQKSENFTQEERKLLDRLSLTSEPLKEFEAISTYTTETRESLILSGLICYETMEILAITAPIITQLVIHLLHGSNQPLLLKTLPDFVIETLKRLSPDALEHSLSYNKEKKSSTIYERQWQMEFYRAARSVLQPKYHLSPDYGDETSDGAIDFFIDEGLDWGIELLRDGKNLLEHVNRFKEGGHYFEYSMKAFVILDFRPDNSKPQMKNYEVPVWYVLYSKDYKTLKIKQFNEKDITFNLTLCGPSQLH